MVTQPRGCGALTAAPGHPQPPSRPHSALGLTGHEWGCVYSTQRPTQPGTRGDPLQTEIPTECPDAWPKCYQHRNYIVRSILPRRGGAECVRGPPRQAAGCSPGRWGRSGRRRRGTPHGSFLPRSPGRRRGWQQPSLKSRDAALVGPGPPTPGPHPCEPSAPPPFSMS